MSLTKEAQAVVDAFGTQPGVTAQQLQNLQHTIDGSPALTKEINDSVAQGHLQRIVPLTNPHAGGEYNADAKEMRLPPAMLTTPASGTYSTGEATYVLGHELQHSFNAVEKAQAVKTYSDELTAVAKSPDKEHDYTGPVGKLLASSRRDEAGAEISGWNAMVSAAQKEAKDKGLPEPTVKDVYLREPGRMGNFVDVDRSHVPPTYAMKPNLEVDPTTLQMAASPKNLEGMGQNFFDRATTLGHNGNSNYHNYYGANAVGDVARFERFYNPPQAGQAPAHDVRIDMTKLGLDPRIVAENGINLGSDTTPLPYVDKSGATPVHAQFRHTATTHAYAPVTAPAGPPTVTPLDDAAHPDHGLYRQTLDAVHRLDAQHGRASDVSSNNLAAAVTVQARRDGLHEINHVVLSDDKSRTFGVQGDLHSPTKQITEVGTAQAVNTSVAQSSQQWQQHAAMQQAQQGQQQNQSQQAQQSSRQM